MSVNWTVVFNRLFKIMDRKGDPCYYSGPRYIQAVQEVREDFPNYTDYINQRSIHDVSTTRRDYFKDILLFSLDKVGRLALVRKILEEVDYFDQEECSKIRMLVGGVTLAPSAVVPVEAWNSDRLNEYLKNMDVTISAEHYERTVTLAYTCLEGFLKAFVRAKIPSEAHLKEILDLAKAVKAYIRQNNPEYPDEITALVGHIAHTVNITRDRFSESHFGGEPARWVAVYLRDMVNSQIRLLLHFM